MCLLCRADRRIPEDERAKISMFSNVMLDNVISVWDADSIYQIPSMLHRQRVDELVCEKLNLQAPPADLSVWDRLVVEHRASARRSNHWHGRQVCRSDRVV